MRTTGRRGGAAQCGATIAAAERMAGIAPGNLGGDLPAWLAAPQRRCRKPLR